MLAAVAIVASCVPTACSTKKNTAVNRQYQAFITRYNILFNGEEHYNETLSQLENNYIDDYNHRLYIHPVYASPQNGSFDRSIEKATKAIQLRSIKKKPRRTPGRAARDPEYAAWLKREEYNPLIHKAWMLLGKSQFMNGTPQEAASTFNYVARYFWWLPSTITEAKIWKAKSLTLSGDWFEAESEMEGLTTESPGVSEHLDEYYLVKAEILMSTGREAEAIAPLSEAVNLASGRQKIRLRFLLAQLLQETGRSDEAFEEYGRIAGSQTADHRTRLAARIRQTEVFSGRNIAKEVKSLESMLRFGKNADYADRIRYAIGNLYLSRGDTARAMASYRKAIDESKDGGFDQALSRIKLGEIYFTRGRYDLAQPEYAAAVPVLPDSHPGYRDIKTRSDVLDELALYAQNVILQDSLLRLSEMSPEEQNKVVGRLISELKKKEKEEAEEARLSEHQAALSGMVLPAGSGQSNAPSTFTLNTDKSWYFYNDAVRNAGRVEFQKRWGNRKLEDDWRRRNKATFSFEEFDQDSIEDSEAEHEYSDEEFKAIADSINRQNDPHFPEYYLRQIPENDRQKAMAHDIIQEGLYNMGVILKDKLDNSIAAEKQFMRLLDDYPDNIYRLEAYNNLFLMYMRADDTDRAKQMRIKILDEFADSPLGHAMANPDYLENLKETGALQEQMYDQAYRIFLSGEHTDSIHMLAGEMSERWPTSRLMPKFMFLDALAYVGENNSEQFGSTLRTLLERYPESDVSPVASSWLRHLTQGRKLNSESGTGSLRPMIWDIRLGSDTLAAGTEADNALQFAPADEGEQLLILTYPTDSINANKLLYDVARYNFNTFTIRDFDLEQMNFGNLGMLIISGFVSPRDIETYRRTLPVAGLPAEVIPVIISRHNFNILLSGAGTFDDYFRAVEQERLRTTHEQVLPPYDYPSPADLYSPTGEQP